MEGYCRNCMTVHQYQDSDIVRERLNTAVVILGGRAHSLLFRERLTAFLKKQGYRAPKESAPTHPVEPELVGPEAVSRFFREETPSGMEEVSKAESEQHRMIQGQTDVRGTVLSVNRNKKYFIVGSESRDVFVPIRNCVRPLAHECQFYVTGQPVLFDYPSQPVFPNQRIEAVNVRLARSSFYAEVEHQIIGVVSKYYQGFGFIRRACGCDLFFVSKDILSTAEALYGFGPGSEVLFNTYQERDGRFRAIQIEIFKPQGIGEFGGTADQLTQV
jgi:cold shock CspA family protein